MINSGVTALFVSEQFVKQNDIATKPLAHEIAVHNIDRTQNKAGSITHYAQLQLKVRSYEEVTKFLITDLGLEDIILGLPWLQQVNPQIDWFLREMEVPNGSDTPPEEEPYVFLLETKHAQRWQWVHTNLIEDQTDQVWCLAGYTYASKIATRVNEKKQPCPFKEMVPPKYYKHAKVFSEEESQRLPKNQPWNRF